MVAPEPEVDAPVSDLLGTILSGQSLLMLSSADVLIHRDGSLSAKRSGRGCGGWNLGVPVSTLLYSCHTHMPALTVLPICNGPMYMHAHKHTYTYVHVCAYTVSQAHTRLTCTYSHTHEGPCTGATPTPPSHTFTAAAAWPDSRRLSAF